jgi:hypothetical protein
MAEGCDAIGFSATMNAVMLLVSEVSEMVFA